jgi:hypothetical protein
VMMILKIFPEVPEAFTTRFIKLFGLV